jgi:hypothetical protein
MSRAFGPRRLGVALAFLLPAAVCACRGDDLYRVGASSGEWAPREWTHTTTYENIRTYADRPDEPTLRLLSVEWQPPELDALGNICTVRGRVVADGQKPPAPINWFQGVTVYLATAPDARPDWSKGMNQADTTESTELTRPDGTFVAYFDIRKARQDRGRARPYQFGVALAKHRALNKTDQQVVWNSRAPAVPSSVRMLPVPAARALSRELEAINRASGWPFQDPNGVGLIRAVNALQPLGKERALTVLEEYAESARAPGYFSDEEIVFWIVHLLFEPVRLGDRIPPPAIGVFLADREAPEAGKWPLDPMAVHADVPFMLGHQIGGSGPTETPWDRTRWVRLHGVVRDARLAPTMNPLAAAEAIQQSRRFKALDPFTREQATAGIRAQALAMVKGLLPPRDERARVDDAEWRSYLKRAADAGIRWDGKREQFVTGLNP